MGITGLLWDIDDTLFDYTGAERLGVLQHLSDEGLLGEFDSPEQALALWQQDMERAYARFLAGELSFLDQRRERVRLFLECVGRSLPDEPATDAWFGRYIRCYEDHWRIFPDVLPVLDALRDRYAHGLLSNSSTPHQHRKLEKLGLRRRFSSLVCSDEIGFAKPAAEAFAAGCAALRQPPGQVVYIGDKLATDALGARDAGLAGVWLDRPATDPAAAPAGVHRIHTLADLPGLLELIDFGAMPPIG